LKVTAWRRKKRSKALSLAARQYARPWCRPISTMLIVSVDIGKIRFT
jgi:hypothetical protein